LQSRTHAERSDRESEGFADESFAFIHDADGSFFAALRKDGTTVIYLLENEWHRLYSPCENITRFLASNKAFAPLRSSQELFGAESKLLLSQQLPS